MAKIIGVRFRGNGKVYYFDPGRYVIKEGSGVIVETSQGVEFAEVVIGTRDVTDAEIVAPLKEILRIATPKDIEQAEQNRRREKEAAALAEEKIRKHGLDMKLVRVEYGFDGSKIVFYFTSEGRVDFRELVKDLAAAFKTRIELRQIGARDEAKMLGGLGPCGLPCCCNQFLSEFQPVSIKMAKEQGLSLNPSKISGLCGRLMCCLKYEQNHYELTRKLLPKIGTEVRCRDGVGRVCELNMLRERVKVKLTLPGDAVDIREYYYKELTPVAPGSAADAEAEAAGTEQNEDLCEAAEDSAADTVKQEKNRPQRDRNKKGRVNTAAEAGKSAQESREEERSAAEGAAHRSNAERPVKKPKKKRPYPRVAGGQNEARPDAQNGAQNGAQGKPFNRPPKNRQGRMPQGKQQRQGGAQNVQQPEAARGGAEPRGDRRQQANAYSRSGAQSKETAKE